MKLSPNEIAHVLITTGGPTRSILDEVKTGVAVWLAESGGDTDVFGKVSADGFANWDHGAAQVSNKWHGVKLQEHPDWRDPYVMGVLTWLIYDESVAAGKPGWNPWHVYTSGSYKTWLPAAEIGIRYPFPYVSPEEIALRRTLGERELHFEVKQP